MWSFRSRPGQSPPSPAIVSACQRLPVRRVRLCIRPDNAGVKRRGKKKRRTPEAPMNDIKATRMAGDEHPGGLLASRTSHVGSKDGNGGDTVSRQAGPANPKQVAKK